ncbi:calcium:proton antiporter [Terasakiella pusilla]|jgi:Ca2+:H+ antiporter|uniref:calcium:proton antiporter n=1 Tax=Terasakiella pusilla TaxID=64973 RepID=UPI003AA886A1
MPQVIRQCVPFLVSLTILCLFLAWGDGYLTGPLSASVAAGGFIGLFGVVLYAAFGVVHHAEKVAHRLGEPYGTLLLTFSVTGIEVALIATVMLTGEASPTLTRDTMLAVLMIVLNGFVGLALLLGGFMHKEQSYNLQGANAFLAVIIPLAVIALVLPRFTVSTSDPTFSTSQSVVISIATVLLYFVFISVQTFRHRGYFQEPVAEVPSVVEEGQEQASLKATVFHALVLFASILVIVFLSKRLAVFVDFGVSQHQLPISLGGVIIALIVLTPEGLSALNAARKNALQRSVNLLMGSALATIGLSVPIMLFIGLSVDQKVILGLDSVQMILLLLTLLMSALTFGGARTGVLHGAVHLVLFITYILLIYVP